MNKLFYLLICPAVLSLGACNMAGDKDYENMATDICDCVNKSTTGISDGMKDAVVDAVKNGKNLEAALTEKMMEDPEQGMKDAQAMTQLETGLTGCMNTLEKKYDDVYTSESETEVQQKLMVTLEKNQSCPFTHAIFKLGVQEMQKGK